MLRQPNVEGIKQAAQHKRDEAFRRTETALRELIKRGREISFASVSELSGVSRTWLYRNETIRARIEDLRSQSQASKVVPASLKPTESSKNTIIETLKRRVKNLEAESQDLKAQIEVAYGLADPGLAALANEQQQEIAELTKQNQNLVKELNELKAQLKTSSSK